MDVEDGPGGAAAPGGDLGDVGEEEGVEAVQGRQGDAGELGERRARPCRATSPAPPRAGRGRWRRGWSARFLRRRRRSAAPSPGSRRWSRRCPRPARAARPLAATASPPPTAVGRSPSPTASNRTSSHSRIGAASRRMPSTAAKLSCQPTLPATLGSIARVTTSAEAEGVEAGGAAARQRRQEARCAHHARPLDRGAGAGQRHVDGDQGDRPDQPLAQGHPEGRQDRHRQQGEQGHVLAADRDGGG